MNFIRENETKYILSTYKSMTPKNLMEYLLEYNYDNDCVYIFNNLPKEVVKANEFLDNLVLKANDEQIKVQDEQIKANDQKLKQLDVMIEFMKQYNKQLDNDIYLLEHQLENKRELNRQLGIF
ncbi:041L [Invertebrate iridescent virus Kaz2018]|nr:041L [Invertebrate iridescent virus Kaz2018]